MKNKHIITHIVIFVVVFAKMRRVFGNFNKLNRNFSTHRSTNENILDDIAFRKINKLEHFVNNAIYANFEKQHKILETLKYNGNKDLYTNQETMYVRNNLLNLMLVDKYDKINKELQIISKKSSNKNIKNMCKSLIPWLKTAELYLASDVNNSTNFILSCTESTQLHRVYNWKYDLSKQLSNHIGIGKICSKCSNNDVYMTKIPRSLKLDTDQDVFEFENKLNNKLDDVLGYEKSFKIGVKVNKLYHKMSCYLIMDTKK